MKNWLFGVNWVFGVKKSLVKRDLFLVVSVCFGIFSLEEDEVDERTPQFHASTFTGRKSISLSVEVWPIYQLQYLLYKLISGVKPYCLPVISGKIFDLCPLHLKDADVVSFNATLWACEKAFQWQQCLSLLRWMEVMNAVPETFIRIWSFGLLFVLGTSLTV